MERLTTLDAYLERRRAEIVARFWSNITKVDGCWEWSGYRNDREYGQFQINGKAERAHRVAWELVHGVIPVGLHVCHRCDNPPCVNPDHLFLGTHQENMGDREAKGRTRGNRRQHGEANVNAKLTWDQVREIRSLATGSWGEQARLAIQFGVPNQTISEILNNRAWKEDHALQAL